MILSELENLLLDYFDPTIPLDIFEKANKEYMNGCSVGIGKHPTLGYFIIIHQGGPKVIIHKEHNDLSLD